MAFAWKDFLDLANCLHLGTNDYGVEAAQRSAVSRAYYAAFCHARNHARQHLGYQMRGSVSDHEDLPTHLENAGLVEAKELLDDLRKWRNKCDYDDYVGNLPDMMFNAFDCSKEIFDKIS